MEDKLSQLGQSLLEVHHLALVVEQDGQEEEYHINLKRMDMANNWTIDEVIDHPKLSDDFKIKFFEELFGEELSDENVEHAFKKWRADNIRSSNVKKIMYNDETKEMFIQFQEGDIYTYFEVPFQIFLDVSGGKATCITSGENKYGSWFVGKTPSNGAAVWRYLRDSNIKYKKGGSLK
jgi:hypothetical protein